jgi:hypothetical protein
MSSALRLVFQSCATVGVALGTVGITSFLFTGCSGQGSQGSGGGGDFSSLPAAGPDVPLPAGVTLQPDVVIVHGGLPVLKALSSDHGVWTIDKNADGASGLAAGKVLLIAGVDCARATDVKDNGDGTLDVTVAPVMITEVVRDGMLSFDSSAIDFSHGVLGQVPYGVVVANETSDAGGDDSGAEGGGSDAEAGCVEGGSDASSEGGSCSAYKGPGLHLLDNPSNSVSVTIGAWTVKFSGSKVGDGMSLVVNAQWNPNTGTGSTADPSQTLGAITTTIDLTVKVNNMKGASGSVHVSGGTLTDSSLTADISGSADMNAKVSTDMPSQFPKQALLKLPFSLSYPLWWGPIPFYLSGTLAFLVQPSLASKMSVLGLSGHVDFAGPAGISFSGGNATPASVPTFTTPDNPLNVAITPPEVGTMAAVFAVQGPRIGLGIGTSAFSLSAKGGLFVDVVNSLDITVASATALLPCRAADWHGVAHGGGEMSIMAGPAKLSVTHQIDLATFGNSWYDPMVAGCKP